MSEPKYPRAWGVFSNGFYREIYLHRTVAEMAINDTAIPDPNVVELIPRPEVNRLVAEAVRQVQKQLAESHAGTLKAEVAEARADEREAIRILIDRHVCDKYTVDRNPLNVLDDILSDIRIREASNAD